MLQINVHCHQRILELEKLFNSLLSQDIDFRPNLNIIIDPASNGVSKELRDLIFAYKETLNDKYKVVIYKFSRNVGLACAIMSGLKICSSYQWPTMVLEDDIVLLDNMVVQNVCQIYKDGFEGHINLWQPVGFYITDSICNGSHMWCWGWAIDHKTLSSFLSTTSFNLKDTHLLKLASWGYDFINHLIVNFDRQKQTWAIFYYVFILTNCHSIYNFSRARAVEASVDGTNRKSSKLRNVINKINHLLVRPFLMRSLHPNIRYRRTFTYNILLPYRILRSALQIFLYKKQFASFVMRVDLYSLSEFKR